MAGSSFEVAREATVGRASQNEITLHPNVVSGQQARIFYNDSEHCYFVEDLGSRNGTMLDGMLVTEPMRLDKMHVITFANALDFIFLDLEKLPGAAAAPPPQAAPRPQAVPDQHSWQSGPTEAFKTPIAATPPAPAPPAPAVERAPQPSAGIPAASEEGEKTRIGDVFDAMPKLGATPPPQPPATPPPAQAPPPTEEAEKTRFGDAFGAMPDLGGTPPPQPPTPASPPEPDDVEKTRLGDAFSAMPDLGAEPAPQSTPAPAFRLAINFGDGREGEYTLKTGANTIGRISDADITLPDGSISRQHAVITVRNQKVFIRDEGSKNGTFINRQRLVDEIELLPGATVLFGHKIQATLHHP